MIDGYIDCGSESVSATNFGCGCDDSGDRERENAEKR